MLYMAYRCFLIGLVCQISSEKFDSFNVTKKTRGENFIYDNDVDHLKDVADVRWSLDDDSLPPSNGNGSRHNNINDISNDVISQKNEIKTEKWDKDENYWKGEDEVTFMNKSMYIKHVGVWRDFAECQHALNILRHDIKLGMVVHKTEITMKAERWAVALAAHLDKDDPEKIYLSKSKGYGKKYGQLVYYADRMKQAPGCAMAIVAWTTQVKLKLASLNQAITSKTKAIAGDYEQLVWRHTHYFGFGLSFNTKKKAGYVVMFFEQKFIDGKTVLEFKTPEGDGTKTLNLAFWQLMLPGFRNPLTDIVSFKTNLGLANMPCISRDARCDKWASEGQCKIPALYEYMWNRCHRSCMNCVRSRDVPIDGGWSSWTQVSGCSAKDCSGGYKVSYRFCNMPPKLYGGRDCPGERVRKNDCDISSDCPSSKRSHQCYDKDFDCEKRKIYCDHKEYGAFTKAHCQRTCKVCP